MKQKIIKKQIELWQERGIINNDIANSLRNDISCQDGERPSFSLFQVLAAFATVAFTAAVLLFIASNWQAIPRLVRVTGVFALIFSGFVGGALVNRRRMKAPTSFFARRGGLLEELCYAIGGAAYVGGVSLVAQMYHLQGRLDEAMLGFGLGLALAGVAVRSRLLGLAALFCMVWWYVNTANPENVLTGDCAVFFLSVAAMLGLALYRDDILLRRAAYVAAFVGLWPFLVELLDFVGTHYLALPKPLRVSALSAIVFAAVGGLWLERYQPAKLRAIAGFARPRVLTFFIIGIFALLTLYGELGLEIYYVVPVLMAIGFSVITLFLHGAHHHRVRYLAYGAFVFSVMALFGDNVLTMLGSSGVLFMVSGLLAVLAYAFYRLERRFGSIKARSEKADV